MENHSFFSNNPYRWLINAMAITVTCFLLCGCDGHNEVFDTGEVGHILCTDGNVRSYEDMVATGTEPIAVVFYGNASSSESDGDVYAVYLYDIEATQYADSIGVSQGSSADITALDGKENTYAIMSNTMVSSPMADRVFELLAYGQSGYIGSVAQYRLLYYNKSIVNKYLELCGGDILPDTADDCWYWTSTEVSGAETGQAWLISMENGAIQETPKTVTAKLRPMVTVYRP